MRSRVAWGSEGSDGTAANSTVRALGADSADDLGSGLDITVVAPTYQRADRLERLLRALEAQDHPRDRFEVVVVDDASTDATPKVLTAAQERAQIQLTVLRQATNDRPAPGRNAGCRAASAPVVAFIEDDCTPDQIGRAHVRTPVH